MTVYIKPGELLQHLRHLYVTGRLPQPYRPIQNVHHQYVLVPGILPSTTVGLCARAGAGVRAALFSAHDTMTESTGDLFLLKEERAALRKEGLLVTKWICHESRVRRSPRIHPKIPLTWCWVVWGWASIAAYLQRKNAIDNGSFKG